MKRDARAPRREYFVQYRVSDEERNDYNCSRSRLAVVLAHFSLHAVFILHFMCLYARVVGIIFVRRFVPI